MKTICEMGNKHWVRRKRIWGMQKTREMGEFRSLSMQISEGKKEEKSQERNRIRYLGIDGFRKFVKSRGKKV